MKTSKRQSLFMVGVALIAVAIVMGYVALGQPRVYDTTDEASASSSYSSSQSSTTVSSNSQGATSADSVATTQQETISLNVSYPLNLNTATAEELMTIEGIGEKRAYAIISYREEIGAYTSVEQITNIKGIGDSLYSKVAGYLTV